MISPESGRGAMTATTSPSKSSLAAREKSTMASTMTSLPPSMVTPSMVDSTRQLKQQIRTTANTRSGLVSSAMAVSTHKATPLFQTPQKTTTTSHTHSNTSMATISYYNYSPATLTTPSFMNQHSLFKLSMQLLDKRLKGVIKIESQLESKMNFVSKRMYYKEEEGGYFEYKGLQHQEIQ